MRKFYISLLSALFFVLAGTIANAQLTGIKNIPGDYANLAAAITDLNTQGVGVGGVTLNLIAGNPQTAPVGGYSITATGTSANQIILTGNGNTITAGLQTAGSNIDAIFKIIGGDYITIQGFVMQENPGNTVTTPGATNTMTEWGVALLRASTTDGAQNNTIQNNTISLNRQYPNSFGIYSNVRHAAGSPGTSADITAATGANNNNKVYGNNISNVNGGIVFVGSGTQGLFDIGNDIGGTSAATGNTLTNWGSNTPNSGSFISVSATIWGIFVNQQNGFNVSYNSITSATGIATSTFRGIFNDYSVTAPTTGTFTNSITNNTVTLNSANTTGTFEAIRTQGITGLSTATINIDNNTILNCVISGAASSSNMICIINSSAPGTLSISNNVIQGNTSSATSGGFTGISNTGAVVNTININNNQIGTATGNAITFSAATSGTVIGITNTGAASTAALSILSNDIRGIVYNVSSTSSHSGTGYIANTGTALIQNISSNTFTNLNVNTTGSVTFIHNSNSAPANGSKIINNNSIVTAFNKGGAGGTVALYYDFGSSTTGTTVQNNNNNFSNITVTGVTTISGWFNNDGTGSTPQKTITGNTFNNWTCGTNAVTVLQSNFGNTVTCTNNTITNITGQGSITGISIGSSGTFTNAMSLTGNTITSLSSTGSGGSVTGILNAAPAPSSGTNLIANNTINTLSSTSTTATVAGITSTGSTVNITGHTIHTLSVVVGTSSGVTNGIMITGGNNVNVFKNKIYNLTTSGAFTTTPGVNGILLSGTASTSTYTVYNNLIGDLKAPTAASTDAIRGISVTATGTNSTYNIYYNTVYLNATSAGANFGTTGIFHAANSTSTTATLNLRNNIIVNNSTPTGTGLTVVYRRSVGTAGTLANYASTSNNNLFYTTPSTAGYYFYHDGTGNAQTMPAYKNGVFTAGTIAPRDANSVSENPPFLSTTGSSANFLHIDPSVATQIESGAIPIGGITDDFDGDTRNSTTPDIGADEGNFISQDLTAPTITYTALPISCGGGNRTLTATITDASGVPTSGIGLPVLYWKINSGSYTASTATFLGSNQYQFTLGAGSVPGDVVSYYIVAQDNAATPNVGSAPSAGATGFTVNPPAASTPPTTPSSYSVINVLSGTYNVGVGQTYATLTAAIADYNNKCLGGAVTFVLTDATYSTAETFPIIINANSGASSTNTLTIKPASGVTATITGSVPSGALIKLNGADYVTIDGSNSGGSDRSLTIQNTTTTNSGNAVLWLASPTSGNGATNNTIKNCVIEGNSSTTTFMGVYVGGNTTISTTAAGSEQNNANSFTNNLFRKTQYGLVLYGYLAATPDDNNVISNNSFGTSTAGEGFNIEALHADRQNNLTVSGNDVQNVKGTGSTDMYGIRLLDFRNGQAYNNKVHNLAYTSTSLTKIYGLAVQSPTYTTVGNPSLAKVYNNLIYDITSSGTSGLWNLTGLFAGQGYGDKYYYNSVHLTGQINNSTSGLSAAFANGDGNITSFGTNLDVRNNVFNVEGSSGTGGKVWAYYSKATNLTGTTQNYNDLRCAGTGATNNTAQLNSVNYTSLAAWQSASGVDANSIESNPAFNGTTDLRPQIGSPLVAAGTPVSVTTDILGITRSGTTPTIGAYENAADFTPPSITYTTLTNTCNTSNRSFTGVIITDASGVNTSPGTKPRVYYKRSTDANTFVDNTSGTNGWKYAEANGTTSPFDFTIDYSLLNGGTGVTAGDVIQYFVVAQDLAPTPNIGINSGTFNAAPSSVALTSGAFPIGGTINSYTIRANLSGTYTVGSGGNYGTLTNAVAAYNTGCLTGPVVFSLIDANYNAGETFPIIINANSDASSTNTLTIKPASGVTAAITGSSASSIIKLNGADYVIIDGSNNGTTSQNLTISNTNTSTSSAVVWLASASASDGATNNTIKNTIITGNASTTTLMGIFVGGTSGISITTNALCPNSSNTIQNNRVSKAQYGVFFIGTSNTILDNANSVLNNTIGVTGSGNGLSIGGIDVRSQSNALISGNTVQNISGASSTNMQGINLQDTKNSVVSLNKVFDMSYTGTSTTKLYGITTSTSTFTTISNASANVYYNNTVATLTSNGTSTFWNISGINNNGGYGDKYYYNSVYLTGQLSGTGTGGSAAFSNGNGITNTSADAIDVRNNIFAVNATSLSAAPLYAHYTTRTNYTGSTVDYNDLSVVISSGSAIAQVGFINNTNQTSFGAWQTATAQEANSKNIVPVFTSTTDLHLVPASNIALNNLGTPIPGITTDMDGDTRDASTPDMGADEFTPPNCTGAIGGTATATTTAYCATGTPTITATGYSTGVGSTYQWQKSNDNFVANIIDIAGQTNPASLIADPITSTTYYRLKVTCSSGTATDYSNTITITINANPTVSISAPGGTSACSPNTVTLNATTSASSPTYVWKNNGTVITGATMNSYAAATSGSYTVTVTDATTCSATSSATVVTINPQPGAVTVTPNAATICAGSVQQLTASGGNIISNTAGFIGTGTSTLSATSYPNPFSAFYGGVKHQILFTASELTALGLSNGSQITSIGFDLAAVNTAGICNDFTIRLGNTNNTALTGFVTGTTTVYNGTFTPATTGVVNFTLSSPFTWNGTSNIIVETVHNAGNNGNNSGTTTKYTTTTNNTVYYGAKDNVTPAGVASFDALSSYSVSGASNSRPNVRFGFTTSTANPITWSPAANLYTDAAATTAYVFGTPATSVYAKPSANATYTATATSPAGCTNMGTAILTVNQSGTWLGTTSSNWFDASNWCGGVPTSTTNVVIASGATNMPVISDATTNGAASANNITINSGASLTVNNTGSAGTLNLYGNLTNSGPFVATNGNLSFVGTSSQTISSFTANNVVMNNASGVVLTGAAVVNGTLTLTNGSITLGANNLTLNGSTNGSVASHIITNSTGSVVVKNLAANTTVVVPVAVDANSYNQVTLAANAAHTTDDFTVSVKQGVLTNGTSGSAFTNKVVDRTWDISEAVAGGSDVNITVQWIAAEEKTGFNRGNCYIMHHDGTAWDTYTASAASGFDPYTQTRNNVTSFSPFAVNSPNTPLPVNLLTFSGRRSGSSNVLRWTTSQEQNNRGFYVERSLDGVTYRSIGFVTSLAPNGNSNSALNYIFTDGNIAGEKQYYRLRQVDLDNRARLSGIVLIKSQLIAALTLTGLYPNPANDKVNVQIESPNAQKFSLVVTDLSGKTLQTTDVSIDAGATTLPISVSHLAGGTYLLRVISGEGESQVLKFVKQ